MKPKPSSSFTPQTVQHLIVDVESEDSAVYDQLPELGEPHPERSVGQMGERQRDEHEVEASGRRQCSGIGGPLQRPHPELPL